MQNSLADIVDFVRKGDFSQKNEGQLRSMIQTLRNWHASYKEPEAASLISAVEKEIERRQSEAKHLELIEQEKRGVEQAKILHRESVADSDIKHREQIAESRYANRLSVVAIVVAVLAVAIAILGWRFPRAPHEMNQTQSIPKPTPAPPASNTTTSISLPNTNGNPAR